MEAVKKNQNQFILLSRLFTPGLIIIFLNNYSMKTNDISLKSDYIHKIEEQHIKTISYLRFSVGIINMFIKIHNQ